MFQCIFFLSVMLNVLLSFFCVNIDVLHLQIKPPIQLTDKRTGSTSLASVIRLTESWKGKLMHFMNAYQLRKCFFLLFGPLCCSPQIAVPLLLHKICSQEWEALQALTVGSSSLLPPI